MEACYAAELLPLLVSSVHTQGPSSSSGSPSATQPATRKHLPINGALSDCQQVPGFPSSTPVNRMHLPRTASGCHASSSSSSSSTQQGTSKHLPRRTISDKQAQSFTSPTQHVAKHFPRAFSSCPPSSSSSTQQVKRRCLPTVFLDFQAQGSPHSPCIPDVKRVLLPRAFSDFQASSSSSSSTIQNTNKKHLAMAFVEYTRERFACLSLTQHSRGMHLPRAFLNHHECFFFMLADQQQLRSPSVRTRASIGRVSGSVHGSNSRKGRRRKRTDIVHEGNDQELDNSDEREIVGEPISEDTDSHMFCDDVPYDKDSDSDIYCEDAPYIDKNCTGNLLSNTCSYDSIHGDFWQMDPYYQEYENLETEFGMQGQVLDGSFPEKSNDISIRSEKNSMQISDAGSSQNQEHLLAVQGGNGAAIVLDQQYSFDPEKSLSQQNERGEDMVREVTNGERPASSLSFLQNNEGSYLESRQCYGNSEVDATDLVHRSFVKAEVIGSIGDVKTANIGASADSPKISEDLVTEVADLVDAQSLPVAEQVGQVVEQVADFLADSIKEQVVNVVDQVEKFPAQVSLVAEQVMLKVVDQLPDPVIEQAGQVADQVTQTAEQIVEQVASQVVEPISSTASQIVNFLSSDEDDMESDNEFEAYASLDIPEFKGRQGLNNFTILQEEQGILSIIYDFYIFMLKRSSFEFMLGMFAAPVLLSMIFTLLYLPEFSGLAFDETVRESLQKSDMSAKAGIPGLELSWETVFQVFMFSVSLSTGLQPELAPLSPYTLVVANLNALFAQLIFVFLSGAVFARLSQPSQPVKCSTVAVICPPPSNRRLRKEACHKALLTRYVLVGPQPCELVDVKVDLTYNYNTVTRSGTYFRTSQSLKLMYRGVAQVRPEIAFLNNGMLVRHIIDETSPLYQRTQGMLEKEDAVFSLSVVGLERSSMQSVFHVEHYCVHDKDVIWDAEFVDMILINKKNRRVVDHSLLSKWRTVIPR